MQNWLEICLQLKSFEHAKITLRCFMMHDRREAVSSRLLAGLKDDRVISAALLYRDTESN